MAFIRLRTAVMTVFLAGAAGNLLAGPHDAHGKEHTLRGAVVDLQCYLVHPEDSRGPDHAKCAKACINRGLPVGFLAEDGSLYLLLGPGHDSVKGQVADLAGKTVTVVGTLVEQNGIKALQLKNVE